MIIDEKTYKKVLLVEADECFETVQKIAETAEKHFIEKRMNDALEFLLTGILTNSQDINVILVDALIGVYPFECNDYNHVAVTTNDELPEMVTVLENINKKELEEKFEIELFKKYKNEYGVELFDKTKNYNKNEIFEEIMQEYNMLLTFYQKAVKENAHILVTVFEE
jgi:hypothetical protein